MLDLKSYYQKQHEWEKKSLSVWTENFKRGKLGIEDVITANLAVSTDHIVSQLLIEMRHGLANPRLTYRRATDVNRQVISFLPQMFAERERSRVAALGRKIQFPDTFEVYNFPTQSILSFLIEGEVDEVLLSYRPDRERSIARLKEALFFRMYDAALAISLAGHHDKELWHALLEHLGTRKSWKLLHDSWTNYLAIYLAVQNGNGSLIAELVKTADRLYEARKTDRYWKDFPGYEAGNFANYFIDFRLAAVLKYAQQTHPDLHADINTIHCWKG